MTEKNKELREKVRAVELIATNCLHTQPDGDSSCEEHLRTAIENIKLEVSSIGVKNGT